MRRTALLLTALPLAACVAPAPPVGPPAPAPDLERASTLRAWFGPRQMTGDGWHDTESQFVFGMDGSVRPLGWPVGVEVGLQIGGGGDSWDYYGEEPWQDVFGLSVGLNRRWVVSNGQVLLDLGAGGEWQYTHRDEWNRSDSDDWFGGYARGGVSLRLGPAFWMGIELRGSFGGGPTIFGEDYSGDSLEELLVFGGGF
jgi:hypothetical protein